MGRKLIVLIGLSVAVVLAFPFIVFSVDGGSASMAISVLCWSLIDPIFAIVTGCLSGKDFPALWWFPAVPAVLTFASALLLTQYLPNALFYGGLVLIAGTVGMMLTAGLTHLLAKRQNPKK